MERHPLIALANSRDVKQAKGFREELTAFVTAVAEGAPSPIPLAESVATTRATFAIMDALR